MNFVKTLNELQATISFCESCTGGLVASKLVEKNGISSVFKESFVTYSNESKQKYLGVTTDTLEKFGAVSEQCAREMVEGLYETTKSDVCVSITGIAGPTGFSKDKPIGLVYFGFKIFDKIEIVKQIFQDKERVEVMHSAKDFVYNYLEDKVNKI